MTLVWPGGCFNPMPYQQRRKRLHADGKFIHAHWDGGVKPRLRYARQTGLDGLETITRKPQGDVTLEEIKETLGDQLFLIEGIPAIYFNTTYDLDTLPEYTETIVCMFAPRLILGVSDEISAIADIERLRVVGRWVDEYNTTLDTAAEHAQDSC